MSEQISRRGVLAVTGGAAAAVTASVVTPPAAAVASAGRPGGRLEANKRLVRRYTSTVFNEHRPDLAARFLAPDVVWHGGILGTVTGAEALAGLLGSIIGSIPDLYADEQDIAAEGDLVSVRYVVTGTVTGALLGVPADGKKLRWDAVDIYRITDGKIREEWAMDDIATIMAQIGAFTPPWAA